jgi:arginase
MLSTGNVVYE